MKKNFKLSFILFFFLIITQGFSQKPFASKYSSTDTNLITDTKIKQLLVLLEKVDIPDESSVGIPAYPLAKIIQFKTGSKECFNCISLLTSDECKKIVSFYKENLKNWFDGDFRDCHQFWQGTRWEAMRGKAPNITILPAKEIYKKNFQEVKSEIQIWYASNQ